MIGRYLKLSVFILVLFFASLGIQNQLFQPRAAVEAGKEFRLVTARFCVDYPSNGKYAIHVESGELPAKSKGLVSADRQLLAGDCLSGKLQLSEIQGFTRYAFKARLKSIYTSVHHSPQFLLINELRRYASKFHGDPENLVEGLAIGIDSGLSQQFLTNMKITGLTHLTAVSGANCAIVIGSFWLVARAIRMGRNQRFVVVSGALGAYVALVGPQPSVLRAAYMMLMVTFALEFGRRVWIPAALGLGSVALLIMDPWLVADYGFWLSVMATLGLVLLTPRLLEIFQKKMPNFLAVGLAATIAAQLWCLPLLVQLQGGLTTYSVLANLLVEPVVPVITLVGLVSTLLGPWSPLLGDLMLWLAAIPAKWIVFVANSLANSPNGLLDLPAGIFGVLGVSLFVLTTTIALIRRSVYSSLVSGFLCLLWVGSQGAQAISSSEWPMQPWSVVNCDVGQGDALVIHSGNSTAVIDVGKDPELIDKCLDRLGVTTVDLLVLTHFDMDHVGGFTGLERGRRLKTVLLSPFEDPRPDAKFLTQQISIVAEQVDYGVKGLTGTLGEFNWVVFSSLAGQAETANQASLGIRFEDSEEVIYCLADLDETAQDKSISDVFDSPKPTIVKVSHHGSADQSSAFYRAIGADLALISVGKGNPYGHPTSRILEILQGLGVKVIRTDVSGGISLQVVSGGIDARVTGSG